MIPIAIKGAKLAYRHRAKIKAGAVLVAAGVSKLRKRKKGGKARAAKKRKSRR